MTDEGARNLVANGMGPNQVILYHLNTKLAERVAIYGSALEGMSRVLWEEGETVGEAKAAIEAAREAVAQVERKCQAALERLWREIVA